MAWKKKLEEDWRREVGNWQTVGTRSAFDWFERKICIIVKKRDQEISDCVETKEKFFSFILDFLHNKANTGLAFKSEEWCKGYVQAQQDLANFMKKL